MNLEPAAVLEESAAELVLRYLKHRWGPALPQLLPAGSGPDAMRLDDLDLDTDTVELERAVGLPAVERVAIALLGLEAPPAEGSRALKALAPEVTGPAAHGLLGLVGLNLAFRLRTDALLQALVTAAGRRTAPRPAPAAVGKLLARARSGRAARALAEKVLANHALGLGEGSTMQAELLAGIVPPPPPPRGARLHVDAPQEAVERALVSALKPKKVVRFSGAGPDARRYLVLRRRGAWTTVLAEGDDVAPEVGQAVARQGGVRRAAWARFGPATELDLRVWEGPRQAFDRAKLEAQCGAPPEADDVAGALRALGVLDLDPDHPRGETHLLFVEHLGGGPPLGHERKLRQAGARPVAFE